MLSRKDTHIKKELFLTALEETCSVYHASQRAGIARRTAYRWQARDKKFAAAWVDALDNSIDNLEQSLYERAMKQDTIAAIFLLKARRPALYSDRLRISYDQIIEDTKRLAKENGLDEMEAVAAAKQIMGLSK